MGSKIIYPDLSYKIIGACFEIHRELGGKYQEKYYQRALEIKLKELGIPFRKELCVPLKFSGQDIGKYFIDFLVNNKVVVELKVVPNFSPIDFKQVSAYLKSNGLKLGILLNFKGSVVTYRRILNSEATIQGSL